MRYIFTTLIITFYMSLSFAGETNDIINRERLRRKSIVKEEKRKNNNFDSYKELSKQKICNYRKLIKTIKDGHIKKSKLNDLIRPAPQAVIFVSFSMPSLSLKQIINDSSRYQVPIVIRGLYKNSFRKTMEKIFNLVKEDNKGGVLINSLWFRKYDIRTVPAVVVNNGSGIEENSFDVVYGNIPLEKALKIVDERGNASKVAKNILDRTRKKKW